MKKILSVLIFYIIFISIFTACTKQSKTIIPSNNETSINKVYFSEPDKILVYKKGTTQTINKEDKLFSNIINQINDRVDSNVDVCKLEFDENNMKVTKQKEVVVEFVYSKKQKSKFRTFEKEYYSLIFPLTGDNKDLCFFNNNKNDYSGPIGKLKTSDGLLDLLK